MSRLGHTLSVALAWVLGFIWLFPLIYAVWAAIHPSEFVTRFVLTAPLTLDNFKEAWNQAPFMRYMLNTVAITLLILAGQLVLCTLAAYALARMEFAGRGLIFALVLMQLMVVPEILIVENYQTLAGMNLIDTYWGVALPYFASAFGIFLLRQTFKTVPQDLENAARIGWLSQLTWRSHWFLLVITGTIFCGRWLLQILRKAGP